MATRFFSNGILYESINLFFKQVGTVDVRVRRDADEQQVLTLVTEKLSSLVASLTVQVFSLNEK